MKKINTLPMSPKQEQQFKQKVQTDKIKQTQFNYIPDSSSQKDIQKNARPYIMMKPHLQMVDENNTKKMKLSFHHSITDLQTFEDLTEKEQPKPFVRKSMRHLTQL